MKLSSTAELRQKLCAALKNTTLAPQLPDSSRVHAHFPQYREFIVGTGLQDGPFRRAGVLIGIVDHEDELTVLLTKRSEQLRHHGGQISFPGGIIEPEDEDAEAAALREANEEVGILFDEVSVVGYLPSFETFSGYSITPIVGLVTPGYRLQPDAFEVAEVFEVPLSFFLDPENEQRGKRDWKGQSVEYSLFRYSGHEIWGATAGLLQRLVLQIQQSDGCVAEAGFGGAEGRPGRATEVRGCE